VHINPTIHLPIRPQPTVSVTRIVTPMSGGELITLIFPVDPTADPTQGPPFPVTPELYSDLLLGAGA